jgi:hypothetical protein
MDPFAEEWAGILEILEANARAANNKHIKCSFKPYD